GSARRRYFARNMAAVIRGAEQPYFGRRNMEPSSHISSPEIWLLGSSDYGGALAAQLGLRFAFAHFISAFGGEAVARAYRDQYQASEREPQPRSLVCAFVICAKTGPEAERLAASIDLRRLHMAKGVDAPVPTFEEAQAYRYSPQERAYIGQQRSRLVHGDPGEVREKLL